MCALASSLASRQGVAVVSAFLFLKEEVELLFYLSLFFYHHLASHYLYLALMLFPYL
jgi:hypothetical protein